MSCTEKKIKEDKHTKDTGPGKAKLTTRNQGKQEENLDLIVGKSLAQPGKQIENFNALQSNGKAAED